MDWATISPAISAWLSAVTGATAVRADLNVKRPAGAYLTYKRITGALPRGDIANAGYRCTTRQDRVVDLAVDSPAPASVSLDLIEAGVRTTYTYNNTGGESSQAMRDGLLAALAAATAVVAAGPDARLTITGDFGYANASGCVATETQRELVEDRYLVAEFGLSVQAFRDAPAPDAAPSAYDPDAMALIESVLVSLSDRAVLADLIALDVEPISATTPVDITALVGTEMQSRAATTITFRTLLHTQRTEQRMVAAEDPTLIPS